MEKVIFDLIEKKAGKALRRMTDAKAHSFRMIVYAGLRFTQDHLTLSQIADELCYSESGIHKLIVKWKKMLDSGDVNANLINTAYTKGRKKVVKKQPKKEEATQPATEVEKRPKVKCVIAENIDLPSTYIHPEEEEEYDQKRKQLSICKTKVGKCLGFDITIEDELRRRAAIRSAIRFFSNYGKGSKPRMNGEYFQPKNDSTASKAVWIPQEQAMLYCGCTEKFLTAAATQGLIERRTYKRSGNHLYYEYLCSDLDRLIKDNNLS